jgi:hypothetical protein
MVLSQSPHTLHTWSISVGLLATINGCSVVVECVMIVKAFIKSFVADTLRFMSPSYYAHIIW